MNSSLFTKIICSSVKHAGLSRQLITANVSAHAFSKFYEHFSLQAATQEWKLNLLLFTLEKNLTSFQFLSW